MKPSLHFGITVNILFLLLSPLVTAAAINEYVAPGESHPTPPDSHAPSAPGPGPGSGLAKANSSESTPMLGRREENARFTYYEAGEGACGGWNSDSDCVVALNSPQWDGGSHCFKWINAYYQGNNVWAQIVDECPGCPWGALDMSKCAFSALASPDVGMVWGGWHYQGESTKARDPPPPPPPQETPAAPASFPPQQNPTPAPAPPAPSPPPEPQPQPQPAPQPPQPVDAFQPIANVEVNIATPNPSTMSMSTTSTSAEISSVSASGGGGLQRAQATNNSSTTTRTDSTETAPTSDGTGPTTIHIPPAAELGAGIFRGGHIFHSGAASLEDLNWGFIVLGLLVSTIL